MQENGKGNNIKPVFKVLNWLKEQKDARTRELGWLEEFQPKNKEGILRISSELYVIEGIMGWIIREFAKDE